MSKPLFLFAAAYDNLQGAESDYDVIRALHSDGHIGSYDANIISKGTDGKVNVSKTELPTQHGAWVGLAGGAAAGLLFPVLLPSVIAGAVGGAGIGAWVGHLAHGTSRTDAKELGALLEEGTVILLVVGIDKDAEAVEKAVKQAKKQLIKQVHGDFEDAENEVTELINAA